MTYSNFVSPGVSLQGGGGSGSGTASLPISGNGATVTASTPLINGTQTWNDGATTFTALKFNITDTASNSASLLMDLQVGGASKVKVGKNGGLALGGGSLNTNEFNTPTSGGLRFGSGIHGLFPLGSTELHVIANGTTTIISSATTTRINAGKFVLGAADAAAPVAQTLSVQSVVAGTTNTAGANLTITGSQGTGTGAGGSIVFQVAPAGSSGTAQNALATALTIDSTGRLSLGDGSISAPVFRVGTGTSVQFYSRSNGWLTVSDGAVNLFEFQNASGSRGVFNINSTGAIQWCSGGAGNTGGDTILARDAANTLALRNGANAQESRIYGSYTDATNYQRMSIKTLRESSGALSGASYTTTIAIPAYANLIGVTTRVTTAITGATSYSVGDGSDVDLWGATIGVTLGSQSRTADFTAVGAVGAAATSRTVTLTANGSNFTGGVVEICLHYLTTEAD